jgi:hypothetical protein
MECSSRYRIATWYSCHLRNEDERWIPYNCIIAIDKSQEMWLWTILFAAIYENWKVLWCEKKWSRHNFVQSQNGRMSYLARNMTRHSYSPHSGNQHGSHLQSLSLESDFLPHCYVLVYSFIRWDCSWYFSLEPPINVKVYGS